MTEPKIIKSAGNRGKGRPKGVPNKKTAALQKAVADSGETPLDFLLGVMRDDMAERSERIDCAKAAAPYVHAKLSAVDAKVDVDGKITLTWEG